MFGVPPEQRKFGQFKNYGYDFTTSKTAPVKTILFSKIMEKNI
jgi:hypothetical protein